MGYYEQIAVENRRPRKRKSAVRRVAEWIAWAVLFVLAWGMLALPVVKLFYVLTVH